MREKTKATLRDVGIVFGGILGAGAGILALAALMLLCMSMPLLMGFAMLAETEDELLFTSTSPTGAYVLEAYLEHTPAIEPYWVHVDLLEDGEKREIFTVRGQDAVEILWLSDTVAQINGVPVDVTSGERFYANARGYFDVRVSVKAADVQRIRLDVYMGGEHRLRQTGNAVPLTGETDAWGTRARLNVLQELRWDDDFDKKKAGLMVTVECADGQRFTLPYLWEWTAKEYGRYEFTLTGSVEEGHTLKPDGFRCTVTRLEALTH